MVARYCRASKLSTTNERQEPRRPCRPSASMGAFMHRLYFASLFLWAFLVAGSCNETDVGSPCNLQKVRLDPTLPGCADVQPDQQDEAPECFRPTLQDLEDGADKDFISFGVPECDDLTCVRSQGEELPATERDPSGVCSRECIDDSDCESELGDFVCRELVFDQDFLEHLRSALSPEDYERHLGRIENARYCARR